MLEWTGRRATWPRPATLAAEPPAAHATKTQRLRQLLLCALLVGSHGTAWAQASSGSPPNPQEDVRHGAVLCVWYLFREVEEIGDTCFEQKDAKLQAALGAAIDRIDAFIVANAPMTPSELQRAKEDRGLMDPPAALCKGAGLYDRFKREGAPGIDKEVDALLAVPRRPALAPCL